MASIGVDENEKRKQNRAGGVVGSHLARASCVGGAASRVQEKECQCGRHTIPELLPEKVKKTVCEGTTKEKCRSLQRPIEDQTKQTRFGTSKLQPRDSGFRPGTITGRNVRKNKYHNLKQKSENPTRGANGDRLVGNS